MASQACSMNCGCAALGVEGIFDRGGFGVEKCVLGGRAYSGWCRDSAEEMFLSFRCLRALSSLPTGFWFDFFSK